MPRRGRGAGPAGIRVGVARNPRTVPEILRSIYYDPAKAGSFSGVDSFWTAVQKSPYAHRVTKTIAVQWLKRQPSYFLWKPRRVNYPRNKTLPAPYPHFMFAADIWTLQRWSEFNDDYAYVFVTTDMFSRFCTCTPMKHKDSDSVIEALKEILQKFPIKVLFTDRDGAICNPKTRTFLENHGVHSLLSKNELHSYPAERQIQTLAIRLRKAMWTRRTKKWLNLLPKIVQSYNNTPHSALVNGKYSPNDVNIKNIQEIFNYLSKKEGKDSHRPHVKRVKPKFKVGDVVLVSVNSINKFRKGYEARYKFEYFRVKNRDLSNPRPMYTLETLDSSETILGKFYQEEMQHAIPPARR